MINFCSLYSGSSGNALLLFTDQVKILIDAGLSAKKIVEGLGGIGVLPEEVDALVISHEHSDHTRGAGIFSRKFDVPIYANENTWQAMEPEIGPVLAKNKVYFTTGEEFGIKDVCVSPFSIPHDASDPVGFSFCIGNKKVTVATDIGHVSSELLDCLEGSDILLIESNHDVEMLRCGPYPWYLKQRILGSHGHLSNDAAADIVKYMVEKGTRQILLGHLSRENNFPELAYQTVYNLLQEHLIEVGRDVLLDVARRDRRSRVVNL